MRNGYHLSLSLSRELWSDLLAAALPVKIYDGEFDMARNARAALKQLHMRDRVAGLLEDRKPPEAMVRVKDRAKELWKNNREGVYRRLNDVVHVEGTYRVELDDMGSKFKYGTQRVGADAYLKGKVTGTLFLMRENVEVPFVLEKRLGVSVTLGDVHFDREQGAIIGSLRDLGLHLGDNTVLQLLGRLGEYLLEQQLPRVNPLPILKKAQVEEMVGGLGGPLKMKMGVDGIDLEITEDDLTLSVRFGFTQLQLSDTAADR